MLTSPAATVAAAPGAGGGAGGDGAAAAADVAKPVPANTATSPAASRHRSRRPSERRQLCPVPFGRFLSNDVIVMSPFCDHGRPPPPANPRVPAPQARRKGRPPHTGNPPQAGDRIGGAAVGSRTTHSDQLSREDLTESVDKRQSLIESVRIRPLITMGIAPRPSGRWVCSLCAIAWHRIAGGSSAPLTTPGEEAVCAHHVSGPRWWRPCPWSL